MDEGGGEEEEGEGEEEEEGEEEVEEEVGEKEDEEYQLWIGYRENPIVIIKRNIGGEYIKWRKIMSILRKLKLLVLLSTSPHVSFIIKNILHIFYVV